MKTYKLFFIFLFFLLSLSGYSQNKTTHLKTIKPKSGKPSSISRGTVATSGTVYFDLELAKIGNGYVDIPVSFTSPDSIVSLDFAIKFNEAVLTYNSVVSHAPYLRDVLAYFSPGAHTLRLTSNSGQYYIVDQTIAVLRFTRSGIVKESDLTGVRGLLNGDLVNLEIRGHFPFRECSLKFWSDNSPIKYDVNDPDSYLITNIYGANAVCANVSLPVQPDLNGQFIFSDSTPSIKIERDILPSTDVQPVINIADVNLGNKLLVNDLSFVPTIYQVIALDVNTDGVISAGDISQINLRSAKTISEFKQKWNYTNNGNSNGQLSKDWLFIDSTSLASSAYHISTSYPSSDGIGYSKSKVPVVHFCLPAPPNNVHSSYTGILLGDSNGNYATVPNDGKIKRIGVTKK